MDGDVHLRVARRPTRLRSSSGAGAAAAVYDLANRAGRHPDAVECPVMRPTLAAALFSPRSCVPVADMPAAGEPVGSIVYLSDQDGVVGTWMRNGDGTSARRVS